jgi:hypothetical protein
LAVLATGSARKSRRAAYIFCFAFAALIVVAGVVVSAAGSERILTAINRGQDIEGVETLSGRTRVWESLIQYSIAHPQGMGYIAGIRTFWRVASAGSMHEALNNVGGTDSAYMETLADAGWLALAFFLITIGKIAALGLRLSKNAVSGALARDRITRHGLRCALLLLLLCVQEGLESSEFVVPLRGAFYLQEVIVAIILGASVSILLSSRSEFRSSAS